MDYIRIYLVRNLTSELYEIKLDDSIKLPFIPKSILPIFADQTNQIYIPAFTPINIVGFQSTGARLLNLTCQGEGFLRLLGATYLPLIETGQRVYIYPFVEEAKTAERIQHAVTLASKSPLEVVTSTQEEFGNLGKWYRQAPGAPEAKVHSLMRRVFAH